jgi:riboflavin transporter FmnP
MKRKFNTKRAVTLAMFTALAYASLFVMRISGVGGFLTFDVKDAIITIAAMIFGPLPGIIISLMVSFFEMISVSGTGPWGFLMNFSSSATFAAVGSSFYYYMPKLKKTFAGAILGLSCFVVITTGVMLLLNLLVTPIYQNVPVEVVKNMILPLLLPFNLIKTSLSASIVLAVYKSISMSLKKAKLIDSRDGEKFRFDKKTAILTIICVAVITTCVLLLVFYLNGHFEWIRK